MTPAISVVIPTYNHAPVIGRTLDALQRLAIDLETIVVDGGSTDDTVGISQWCGARVLTGAAAGRGTLLHQGALAAKADVLWFVAPDALPPHNACDRILDALADHTVAGGKFAGLFIRRSVYERAGGFAEEARSYERELMKRAGAYGRFIAVRGAGYAGP